jgi:hypothetical protein
VAPFTDFAIVSRERCGDIFDLVKAMQAQVVCPALEQSRRHRSPDGTADQRQVAVIELVLQRLGAGTDDGLAPAHERRQQVGEGLAGSSSGLDDELAVAGDRFRNGFGHPCLSRPWLEARQEVLQRALLGKEFGEVGHVGKVTEKIGDSYRFPGKSVTVPNYWLRPAMRFSECWSAFTENRRNGPCAV